jgi:molecular chaperone HscB
MTLQDDDFTLFGLPQRYALSRAELDTRWRALQAEVHPDRFAAQGAAAQRLAMQWAVRVNEAYQRLKHPLQRAAYLCSLRGAAVNADRNTAMPVAFLQQQMAWREALDDAVALTGAPALAAVHALDKQVAAYEDSLLAALAQSLDSDNDSAAAASQVRSLMFVSRFREDLRRQLEAWED